MPLEATRTVLPRHLLPLLGLACLVILIVGIAQSDSAQAAEVVVDSDWTVNATEPGIADNTYIMRGNLTVTGTGQISFLRCRFKFMSATPGQFGIVVNPGGYLIIQSSILEAGELEPGVKAKAWTFYVKDSGRLSLQGSTLRTIGVVGAPAKDRGLAIESDGVYVVDCTFNDCNRGIVVMSSAGPRIENTTFDSNSYGIEVTGSFFTLTAPNVFRDNGGGIIFQSCKSGVVTAGTFKDNGIAVRAADSNILMEGVSISGMGVAISSELSSLIRVSNSTISTMSSQGRATLSSTIEFEDCGGGSFYGHTETDTGSHITARNSVSFHVVYAVANYPVEGADVELTDDLGEKAYQQVTGEDGTSPVKQVLVFEHHNGEAPIDRMPCSGEASMGYNYESFIDLVILPHHVISIEFMDSEAPDLSVQLPSDGALFNTQVVVLKGRLSDMHSGIKSFDYYVNGGPPHSLPLEDPWQVTVTLPEGELNLSFVAADLVGNVREVSRSVVVDVTPPDIETIEPPAGSVTREYSLLVAGTTEVGTTLSVGGQPLEVGPDGAFTGYVNLGDEEGEQVVSFLLEDRAGNEATVLYRVMVDRTPPDLEVNTDPDYRDFPYVNGSRVTVFGTTEAGATVKVFINSVLANETRADATGEWSLEVALELGVNDFLVDAFDEAGNRMSVEVIDFFYDVTPPEITVLYPEDGLITDEDTTMVRVRTEEGALVWINEGQEMVHPSHGELVFDSVPLPFEGNNTLVVHARDKAGNEATVTLQVVRTPRGGDEDGGGFAFPLWALVLVVVIIVVAVVAMYFLRTL